MIPVLLRLEPRRDELHVLVLGMERFRRADLDVLRVNVPRHQH